MIIFTIITGLVLILLGGVSYWGTGTSSITALIPAFIGIPVTILGIIARNEKWYKHSMHAAVILLLLGFLGSVPGLPKYITYLSGQDVARPGAVTAQAIMAVVTFIYLVFAIRSFIVARKTTKDQ